ncbi:hypothetical protein BC939DRAFT_508675 [Gamsiella multidivaricata]|uniref:uncharacterized protein n=1 Tax=Gamsiella multidivaricata TaxID=101098 RepID=UPI002220D064|nr:uncharacterized protein BC939DRAFT_508675 [Gamsiella multidivaricata]KAI7816049.1 hypothetical protein BC939DRAFT_508675 [Gamsiella multidivaricata]
MSPVEAIMVPFLSGDPAPENVILESKVPYIDRIPPHEQLSKIIQLTNDLGDCHLVHFPGVGYFTPSAIRMSIQVDSTRTFTETLQSVARWIELTVRQLDADFTAWFLNIIMEHKPYQKVFSPSFFPQSHISLKSVLSVAKEEWLDDEVVSGIQAFFDRSYGQGGQYLFAPSSYIWPNSKVSGREKEQTRGGRAKKLFAIAYMGQHWGVVCLDLKKYQVLFGDSIGWPVPHEAIDALVKWMDPPAEDLPKWRKASKNVLPFLTPKQQDSGSCGILAAMAIEQHVNPYVDWSAHAFALNHRVRFLRLLTGYTSMEDDDLVRAFKKYVKDDTQHPTPEEDMADYLHDLFKFSHPDGLTVKGNAKVAVQDEAKVDPQDKAKIAVKDKPKLVVKDNTRAPVEDNARIVVQHKTDIIFDKDSDVD